jgi:hypothetical protein
MYQFEACVNLVIISLYLNAAMLCLCYSGRHVVRDIPLRLQYVEDLHVTILVTCRVLTFLFLDFVPDFCNFYTSIFVIKRRTSSIKKERK